VYRRAVAIGAVVLGFIAVVPATSTAATIHPNVVGAGLTTCRPNGGGVLSFSPALSNTGTASSVTVNLTATGKPCTGGTPVAPMFKLKETATISGTNVNRCSNFFLLTPPGSVTISGSFSGAIAWGGGIVTSTTSTFSLLKSTETTAAAPIKFKIGPMTIGPSYPTTAGHFAFKTVTSLATILGQCANSSFSGADILHTAGTGTF
jgi:hypothetical protein